MRRQPPGRATFVVCPLGPEPARTATLETLLRLRAAAAVYDGGLGPEGRKLLRRLGLSARRAPARWAKPRPGQVLALACEGPVEFLPRAAARAQAAALAAGHRVAVVSVPGVASRALAGTGLILGNDVGRVEVLEAAPPAKAAVLARHGGQARCRWSGAASASTVGAWAKKASGRGALLLGRRP